MSLTDEDQRYMQLALDTCREGVLKGQSPFGSVIVWNGNVVGNTHNSVRLTTDPTAHAEVNCIRAACKHTGEIHLSGATIYSTTEPCPMCFAAIHWARIERIVYGARVEDAAAFGFNELNITNAQMIELGRLGSVIVRDFQREKALELFRLWQNQSNNPY